MEDHQCFTWTCFFFFFFCWSDSGVDDDDVNASEASLGYTQIRDALCRAGGLGLLSGDLECHSAPLFPLVSACPVLLHCAGDNDVREKDS